MMIYVSSTPKLGAHSLRRNRVVEGVEITIEPGKFYGEYHIYLLAGPDFGTSSCQWPCSKRPLQTFTLRDV
jgi:hypothetical protein